MWVELIHHEGSLRIYRALGSTVFLNCQNAIRPILPKSQAWCVDGESKFVLRSPPLFWRIEVPNTTQDELIRVQELKDIFNQILSYEKTPCPFHSNPMGLSPHSLINTDDRPLKLSYKSRTVNELKCHFHNNLDLTPHLNPLKKHDIKTKSFSSCQTTPNHKPELLSGDEQMAVESDANLSLLISPLEQPHDKNTWAPQNPGYVQGSVKDGSYYSTHQVIPLQDIEMIYTNSSSLSNSGLEKDVQEYEVESSRETFNTSQMTLEVRQQSISDLNKDLELIHPGSTLMNTGLECDSRVSSSDSLHKLQPWQSSFALLTSLSESPTHSELSNYPNFDSITSSDLDTHKLEDLSSDTKFKSPKEWDSSNMKIGENKMNSALQVMTMMPGYNTSEISNREASEEHVLTETKNTRQRSQTGIEINRLSESNQNLAVASKQMYKIEHRCLFTLIRKIMRVFLSPPSHIIEFILKITLGITSQEWRNLLSSTGEIINWGLQDDCGENHQFKNKNSKDRMNLMHDTTLENNEEE